MAVVKPVCMLVRPSPLMICAIKTASPTLTPACPKWIAASASTRQLTSVCSTEKLRCWASEFFSFCQFTLQPRLLVGGKPCRLGWPIGQVEEADHPEDDRRCRLAKEQPLP